MILLPLEIEEQIPLLYSTENYKPENVSVIIKYFYPCGSATWYVTEYSPADKLFFGFAELLRGEGELGYFSLAELSNFKDKYGIGIERDVNFSGCLLQVILNGKRP